MRFKPFETILINTTVSAKFCISWSDDNKISVIAEDGVHIYELCPLISEVFSIATVHSWIPNDSTSPFFDAVINNRINNFLWKLNKSQLCEIVVDSSMPNSFKTFGLKSHVVQTGFSPLICGESYISCLMGNGCLGIYKLNMNKWTPVINVAEEWIKHCMFQAESELDFENFKLRILNLKIVTHMWSEEPDVLFVTGHEDGVVVIWNVVVNVDKTLQITVKNYLQAFETPSALAIKFLPCLSKSAVFVGVVTGRILTFTFRKEGITVESDLWKEQDLIAACLIKPYQIESNLYVFTVKHNIILVQILQSLLKNVVNILKVNWFEFPAPVVGLQRFQNELVIIALQNHHFRTLKICDDLSCVKDVGASLRPKDETDGHCCGLALSKNSALWITVYSKLSCADKSALSVTRLQIFVNYPVAYKSFVDDSSGSRLLEKIVSEDNNIKLTEILDLLELKKFEFLGEQTLSSCWSFLERKNLTLSQLKLLLWEVKLKNSSCNSPTDLTAFADHLKYRIISKYAHEQVDGLRPRSLRKTHLQILSAFLEEENRESDVHFECPVCQEPLSPENFKICSCANFHRFPRCIISFLPCNNTPYAFCRHCNSIALLEYVSDEGNRCPYCDGLLISDNRLRPKMTQGANGTSKKPG